MLEKEHIKENKITPFGIFSISFYANICSSTILMYRGN